MRCSWLSRSESQPGCWSKSVIRRQQGVWRSVAPQHDGGMGSVAVAAPSAIVPVVARGQDEHEGHPRQSGPWVADHTQHGVHGGLVAFGMPRQTALPDRYEVWRTQHEPEVREASDILGIDPSERSNWRRSCQAAFNAR